MPLFHVGSTDWLNIMLLLPKMVFLSKHVLIKKKRNCTIIQKCYVSISSYDVKYVWYLRLEATRGKVEFDNFEIFGSEEKMREKGKVNLKIW